MLIDESYFDNPEIAIPSGSYDTRAEFIDRYEPKILEQLFGYELAKEIAAYTVASDQRIKDIVEGKEFTYGGILLNWVGLQNNNKVSIIAYYVYYWWQRQNISKTNTNTEIKVVSENSVPVTPVQKLSSAWTEYENQQIMLFAFMGVNKLDYPDWRGEPLGNINGFDL